MVLEYIPVKNKLHLFLSSSLTTSLSLIISYFILPSNIGISSSFLITIALTPFLVMYFKEKVKIIHKKEKDIIEKYRDAFEVYASIFLGILATFLLIQHIIPSNLQQSIFLDYLNEIKRIRGSFIGENTFTKIFFNNIIVLFLIFLLSLVYGSASLFIISWNAGVLATAITLSTNQNILLIPLYSLFYLPHGSLEFLAYFIVAVAGSVIYVSLRRKDFKEIFVDCFLLLVLSIAILFSAAFVEVILIITTR
ncbi:MAG: stage II sporulation protein M [Candidatus Aenigmarchaeota archaeon]|nr:stage II sporulation protein M [Candidatus Aenigmarchaeota archaeon]MDW8149139.1 stage II sporulation protein M [Candidatus Aenigmarchaeota archaeon]